MKALARTHDPATSHLAARLVEIAGVAGSQRCLCLEEVRRRPGQTAAEIAIATGLERHIPSRRLPELRDALVRNGAVKICGVTHNRSMTWYPMYWQKAQGRLF